MIGALKRFLLGCALALPLSLIALPQQHHAKHHTASSTVRRSTSHRHRARTTVSPSTHHKSYTNRHGQRVRSPMRAAQAPTGATAKCADSTYSFSQHRRGTCSHHGGVAEWLSR
jgi:Protein of unknown function (DUF3761)